MCEKKTMLLSAETAAGLKLTGTCMCTLVLYIYIHVHVDRRSM